MKLVLRRSRGIETPRPRDPSPALSASKRAALIIDRPINATLRLATAPPVRTTRMYVARTVWIAVAGVFGALVLACASIVVRGAGWFLLLCAWLVESVDDAVRKDRVERQQPDPRRRVFGERIDAHIAASSAALDAAANWATISGPLILADRLWGRAIRRWHWSLHRLAVAPTWSECRTQALALPRPRPVSIRQIVGTSRPRLDSASRSEAKR